MVLARTDAELLISDVPDDFGRFYERHVGAVVAFFGRRVREPEVVFDLVSETFARAFGRRDQYDPDRGPAVGWLFSIARNLLIDSVRRERVATDGRERLGMARIALDDEQLDRVAERSQVDLESSLAGLPGDQREVLLRRFVLEQSYPEIAADLRCSEQVVRKRVSRGRAALRESLEESRDD